MNNQLPWQHQWTCEFCGKTFDHHPYFVAGEPNCSPEHAQAYAAQELQDTDPTDAADEPQAEAAR